MPHAAINGQSIYFEDTGGDGPAVVLAHGFLMDLEMFAPQVVALRDDYRVIAWDERGFGRTEFDDQPFTYWDSARDCLGLLERPGCGSEDRGGWRQAAVFGVVAFGMGVVFWRVSVGVRRNRRERPPTGAG